MEEGPPAPANLLRSTNRSLDSTYYEPSGTAQAPAIFEWSSAQEPNFRREIHRGACNTTCVLSLKVHDSALVRSLLLVSASALAIALAASSARQRDAHGRASYGRGVPLVQHPFAGGCGFRFYSCILWIYRRSASLGIW